MASKSTQIDSISPQKFPSNSKSTRQLFSPKLILANFLLQYLINLFKFFAAIPMPAACSCKQSLFFNKARLFFTKNKSLECPFRTAYQQQFYSRSHSGQSLQVFICFIFSNRIINVWPIMIFPNINHCNSTSF